MVAYRISPVLFSPAGFVAPFAPFLYTANVILLIALLITRRFKWAIPAAVIVLLGLPVIGKTYRWNSSSSTPAQFRVLSYNVGFFSVPIVFSPQYESPDHNLRVSNAIQWLKQQQSEVLCLQEFFDDENSVIYNTVNTLTEDTDYDHHFVYKDQIKNKTRRGLIILSGLPMVGRGTVFTSSNHYNGAIYADVVAGSDTVRIINAHLESMRLGALRGNISHALGAYRRGIVTHAQQAEQLVSFVQQSPYQVILCADTNETPYSYVYHELGGIMDNSFEERGQGFGFTFQGKFASFLRIDQQFSTQGIQVLDYITHEDIPFSKHLPIEGAYSARTPVIK